MANSLLLWSPWTRPRPSTQKKYEHAKSTCGLHLLPREVLEVVLNQLPQEDNLSFSSTCKAYRQFAAPWAFSVLRFSTVADRGSALSALLAAQHYANFVEVLECTVVGDPEQENLPVKQEQATDTILLPTAAAELLSSLQRFPNLHTLKVRFSIPRYKDDEAAYFNLDTFAQQVDDHVVEIMKEREQTLPWRRIVVETWRALARNNERTSLPHVIIERQPPVLFSIFYDPSLTRLLGRVEAFTLVSRRAVSTNVIFRTTAQRWQQDAIWRKELGELFVSRLHQLRRLHIVSDPKFPLSETFTSYMPPFPLVAGSLPMLEYLELEQTLIEKSLLEFLLSVPKRDRQTTLCPRRPLRQLILRNCYCSANRPEPFLWCTFFSYLMSEKLLSLEEVVVIVPEKICTKPGGIFKDPSLPQNKSAVWEPGNNLPYFRDGIYFNTLATTDLPANTQERDQQAFCKLKDMLRRRHETRALQQEC